MPQVEVKNEYFVSDMWDQPGWAYAAEAEEQEVVYPEVQGTVR